ncbi:hypothetical protein [Micromonospora profundi]|uniref:hypothetical protein n=1 Tax=Micromonospora profundi TaxID=1420889 RepID=UPI003668585C
MKPRPSRTVGQLHFEDLEPHRFEDLVRQLAYGFRDWIRLEPLGRSGADDGVDIRGVERVQAGRRDAVSSADPDRDDVSEDRVWFIQCKREKTFGPAKARAVASAALAGGAEPPFAFVLAAPCDLSKRTRDALASDLRAAGVRQVFAWGRGDLEDMLFLPENDHLLFAYFGISLQVRRRSQVAELRSRLTRKREVYRAVGDRSHRGFKPVLVRDPTVEGYPFRERVPDFDDENPPWMWTAFRHHSNPDTLALVIKRHHAWISADRTKFDVIDSCSHVMPHRNGFNKAARGDPGLCDRVWRFFHNEVPEDERGWLEVFGWIMLDDILLVDDLGDAFHEPPHILATRDHTFGFFTHTREFLRLDRHGKSAAGALAPDEEHLDVDKLKRTRLFPDPIPDVQWKSRW